MTGSKRQNTLVKRKVSISFGLSDTFVFESNDLPAIGRHDFFFCHIESYSRSFSIYTQVRGCDGMFPKILIDHILQ